MTLNWHVNVLKDVLKEDELSRIELPSGQPGMKIRTIRDSTHVKYKTMLDVITRYNLRQPISIINFSDVWACRIGDTNQYLEITTRIRALLCHR
jgi:predicted transcriptional regulator